MDEKIEALKEWAKNNYNNGADTMVECWDDSNYRTLLDDCNGSLPEALAIAKDVADVWLDRQADAVNSAF